MLKPGTQKYRLFKALKRFGQLSALGIHNKTGSCCPSTLVSHLRQAGHPVRRSVKSVRGKQVFYYELA